MDNLITKHQNNTEILNGIKNLKLLETNGKFKKGDIISFYAGYNKDILYKSVITGFDANGDIYVLWDCFWSPIRDEKSRNIKLIN